ncbi:MAG TPA: SEC-C metal-binding domain-containing protein [Polyangia bacterium]|nr:SEC-C metal-binding domain-containing protein [Polyangia bacterium]
MALDPRKQPCPCGSGKRYKSCCWARDSLERARGEAAGTARAAQAGVDEVLRVFLPLVESRGEFAIACREGCDACCGNFVRASLPEAIAIAQFLVEHPDVRARFEAKLPGWRERGAPELGELAALLERNGGPPAAGADREAYGRAGVSFGQKRNLCPFDEGGRCEIYPVRPTVCRAVYVLDTAEFCTPGRGAPRQVTHPALDAAMLDAGRAMSRASLALGGKPYEEALPEIVARVLRSL